MKFSILIRLSIFFYVLPYMNLFFFSFPSLLQNYECEMRVLMINIKSSDKQKCDWLRS